MGGSPSWHGRSWAWHLPLGQDNGDVAPPGADTACQILLGLCKAQASPEVSHGGETGGGYINVEQPQPNVLVVNMRGTAAAGADCKGSRLQSTSS